MMNKKMLFSSILALGAVFIWPTSLPSQDIMKSGWAAAPLNIDGVNDDWVEAAFSNIKNVNVDYAFRNDGKDLYLIMIFKDPKFLSSIEATGIKIFFNMEGKKKKDRGLRFFRKMVKPDEFIASLEKKGQTVSEEEKAKLRAKSVYFMYDYELLIRDKAQSPSAQQPGTEAPDLPKFRYKRAGTMTVYEFRIPLAVNDGQPAGIGAEPGKAVKFGFEWGGMTEEMKAARLKQLSGDESGVAGENFGRYVFSASGGGSGPPKHDFWIDVKLSEKLTS